MEIQKSESNLKPQSRTKRTKAVASKLLFRLLCILSHMSQMAYFTFSLT